MNNTNKRLAYLDCVKGLSILCITFLHIEDGVIPNWLNSWIGLFMISTFYFTSGWIFGLKSDVETPRMLFHKRIYQLGIPYIWFSIIILAFDFIWTSIGFMSSDIIWRDIYKTVTLRGIGTLWFLPVLLFGEYLFCLIKTSKKPILYGCIVFIISLICSYIYYNIWQNYLSLKPIYKLIDSPIRPIIMGLNAWPIITVGYLLSCKCSHFFSSERKTRTAFISVLIIIVSIWFVITPPFQFFYLNTFISNIMPVIGFMGVFTLLENSRLEIFLKYWGKNSLILMCTHFSITMEILMAFDLYVMHNRIFSGPRTLIYFIATIILTYPMVPLFKKHLGFMLGKKTK